MKTVREGDRVTESESETVRQSETVEDLPQRWTANHSLALRTR